MLDNLNKYKVILASNSPRRKELMAGLGVDFEVRTIPDIDESFPDHLSGADIPLYIAKSKADAYLPNLASDELLITADTMVWINNTVLGKPANEEEAIAMLRMLSDETHQVITGVCIAMQTFQRSFTASSEVTFAQLSEDEINYYVANFKPLDKAGAYGIQEWIGFIGVKSISGSFFNVMGLPIQRLYQELKNI